jgi:hypothetical protein
MPEALISAKPGAVLGKVMGRAGRLKNESEEEET